jgi:putative toxin-antitoxin system antitoxin component (TIGR02293 family)
MTDEAMAETRTKDGETKGAGPAARRGAAVRKSAPALKRVGGRSAADMLGGAALLHHRLDTSIDAHELLTEGLPAVAVSHLVETVGLLRDEANFSTALGMSWRTHQRKQANATQRLSREQSGRAWKFAEVLSKATDVFGSQERAEQWLTEPAMALDRHTPLELLNTAAGQELVEDLLTRLDYGVYT